MAACRPALFQLWSCLIVAAATTAALPAVAQSEAGRPAAYRGSSSRTPIVPPVPEGTSEELIAYI